MHDWNEDMVGTLDKSACTYERHSTGPTHMSTMAVIHNHLVPLSTGCESPRTLFLGAFAFPLKFIKSVHIP